MRGTRFPRAGEGQHPVVPRRPLVALLSLLVGVTAACSSGGGQDGSGGPGAPAASSAATPTPSDPAPPARSTAVTLDRGTSTRCAPARKPYVVWESFRVSAPATVERLVLGGLRGVEVSGQSISRRPPGQVSYTGMARGTAPPRGERDTVAWGERSALPAQVGPGDYYVFARVSQARRGGGWDRFGLEFTDADGVAGSVARAWATGFRAASDPVSAPGGRCGS
ncbi:hypothetical protein GCM10009719_06030 [Nocardioides kribbensis]